MTVLAKMMKRGSARKLGLSEERGRKKYSGREAEKSTPKLERKRDEDESSEMATSSATSSLSCSPPPSMGTETVKMISSATWPTEETGTEGVGDGAAGTHLRPP